MKNLKIVVPVLFTLVLTNIVYSQGKTSIHFGPSFPIHNFALDDLDNESAGGAATGLNLGLQYVYPLSENGLGVFCGIDFNYNELKSDVKNDMEEALENMSLYNPDIKYYNYINVPLTAGLNYSYKADNNIGLFVNGGLSLNFLKITDMKIEANGASVTQEMEMANSIGLKIGGGLQFGQKTFISIDYLGLGKHDIEGVMRSGDQTQDIDGELTVDMITLTLGFIF